MKTLGWGLQDFQPFVEALSPASQDAGKVIVFSEWTANPKEQIRQWGHVMHSLPNIWCLADQHPQSAEEQLMFWGVENFEQITSRVFGTGEVSVYQHKGQQSFDYPFLVFVKNADAFVVICVVNEESLQRLVANPEHFFLRCE